MSIVVTGGGTGGHLFSARALADELKSRGHEAYLVTDYRCKKYLGGHIDDNIFIIKSFHLRGNILAKISSLFKMLCSVWQMMCLYRKIKPKVVVGFGGYPTFAPLMAAKILNIDIIVHEQNSFLGRVNSFFASYATKIAVAFSEIKNLDKKHKAKLVCTGNPVRQEMKTIDIKKDFDTKQFNILVVGGSQGAKFLNRVMPNVLKLIGQSRPDINISITHQSGMEDKVMVEKAYSNLNIQYEVEEFFFDMEMKYANTHLVICRAGASTMSELIHTGTPAIIIPMPTSSNNHQFLNAQSFHSQKIAWCVQQYRLTPRILSEKIMFLISNREILKDVSENLLKIRGDAEIMLSDEIEKIILK